MGVMQQNLLRFKIILLFLFSIILVFTGIIFIFYSDKIYQNNINYKNKEDILSDELNIQQKNYCILQIYNNRTKESIYFTFQKNFIKQMECINKNFQMPILNIIANNNLNFQLKKINFFLDSYWKIISINPTILEVISEIKINDKEIFFFMNNKKIRIDVKDYRKKNWEEKFISLVIWIIEKNINKAYLDIREEDSLLIVDGEI
ncbi:MAG: hypothetical protein KatS3mg129_0745 [Leptospiraceae bacterium]|nr:MAG: hypothetical protein KatS3mg129_0745 [Leptospiraceae bacterium]